jgi:hypothetical protein
MGVKMFCKKRLPKKKCDRISGISRKNENPFLDRGKGFRGNSV